MFCRVRSMGLSGIEAFPVMVEVDISRGASGVTLIGLPLTPPCGNPGTGCAPPSTTPGFIFQYPAYWSIWLRRISAKPVRFMTFLS